MIKLPKMESVRWAFNTRLWFPSKDDWITALSYIQEEEKERISKFVFKKDAKSSLAGRLMLRKLTSEVLDLPWSETKFGRTDKGRPFLLSPLPGDIRNIDFNVSHQGDWAVLAADKKCRVGTDVMKVEYIGGKTVSEFFHTMRRQFTHEEWVHIRDFPQEGDQLRAFYRHWCLKEGVVKALGIGIGFELQRVSFQIQTPILKENEMTTDTQVKIDGNLDAKWHFEETMLDPLHCVAVALNYNDSENVHTPLCPSYTKLCFEDLITSGEKMTELDREAGEAFMQKEETPWV